MKSFLLLGAALAALTGRAQQLDNPMTVPVTFYAWAASQTSESGSFRYGQEVFGSEVTGSGGGGAQFYANPVTVDLIPGKEYIVPVIVENMSVVNPIAQSHADYEIFLNGERRTMAQGFGSNFSFTVRVELIRDVKNSLAGNRSGESTLFPEDKPIWYLGLGTMRNGRFAGALGFRAASLLDGSGNPSNALFKTAALTYDSPDTSEIPAPMRQNGAITQITARDVVVNVDSYDPNPSVTSYQIKVCSKNTPTIPFITYTISKRTVSGGNGIQIDRLEDEVTWSMALEQVVSGSTTTWTRYGWRLNTTGWDTSNATVTTYNSSTGTSSIDYGGNLQTKQKTLSQIFWGTNLGWAYELTNVTQGSALATNYEYCTDISFQGWLRAVKSITGPTGDWVAYDYYNNQGGVDPRGGLVMRVRRPFLDAPSSPNGSILSGRVETYDYTANFDGNMTAPSSHIVTINSTQVAKTTWDYNFSAGSPNGHLVSRKIQKDYASASSSDYLTTISLSYQPTDGDTYFRGRSHSVTYPDGHKDSYAYYKGTWNMSSKTFTASTNGADRLVLVFHGQNSGGTSTNSWAKDGVTWTIDTLHLVAGRSTITETVTDTHGRLVLSAENAYVSANTMERLAATAYSYDDHGRLAEELDVIRTVGSNKVATSRSYVTSLVQDVTGPDGVVTRHAYDDLLRVRQITEGYGGGTTTPPRIQQMRYDAANRVAEIAPTAGVNDPATVKFNFDSAGRIVWQDNASPSSANGYLRTSYAYPSVLSMTTTLPSGATLASENWLDGRPRSRTGNGRAPEHFDYAVNSTGLKVTRKNGTTTANGWNEVQFDYLGRMTAQSTPTWGWGTGNSNIVDTTYVYDVDTDGAGTGDTATGLLKTQSTTYRANGSKLLADRLYFYDAAGRLTSEGLDFNGNGSLETNSSERITTFDVLLSEDSWGWTEVATTSVHATAGSSTLIQASQTTTRLSGFNNGAIHAQGIVVGDTVAVDANGHSTVMRDFLDPSMRRRRSEVTLPGTSIAQTTTINGYTYESQAAGSGEFTRYEYDNLGRLQYVKQRGDGTTFPASSVDTYDYAYQTGYVSSQNIGGVTTDFGYAWGGGMRTVTSTVQIAPGQSVTSATVFNAMDLPYRVGGSGASPQEYGYDGLGRRTSLKTWKNGPFNVDSWPTSGGDTTTCDIEPATGLLREKIHAGHTAGSSRKTIYTYTPLGQTYQRTWARTPAVTTTYGYDGNTGELTSQTYGGAATPVSYSYTRAGLLAHVDDATGSRDFLYTSSPLRVDAEDLDDTFYGNRVRTLQYDSVSRDKGFFLGNSGDLAADLTQTYVYGASGLLDHIDTKRGTESMRTFTYFYQGNTDLVSHYLTTNFGSFYSYENRNSLRTVVEGKWGSTPATGASLTRFDMARDGRMFVRSTKQSGTAFADHWSGQSYNSIYNYYAYDDLGQVKTAATYRGTPPTFPTLPASADELPGRRFEYRYDSMGNRDTAGPTGTETGGDDKYLTNELNQYTQREHNTVRVLGTAVGNATVSATSTNASPTSAVVTKLDRNFAADVTPANETAAAKGTLTVTSTLSGTPNIVKTATRDWLIAQQTQAIDYDADGNLTSDGLWTYTYDAENRLSAMENPSAVIGVIGAAEARRLEFKYDYLGRRVEKLVRSGWNGTSYATVFSQTRYLYDGWNLVAEFSVTAPNTLTLVRSYTWGLDVANSRRASGGVGALVQIADHASGKYYYPTYDGNGNVVSLVDSSDGSFGAIYEYSPFGELLRAEESYAAINPFRFSTKFTDVESGLVYYGLRYYSPKMGRFINRDPIAEAGGVNLHGFTGNNGVSRYDVLGMGFEDWVDGGIRNENGDHDGGTRFNPGMIFVEFLPVDFSAPYTEQPQLLPWASGPRTDPIPNRDTAASANSGADVGHTAVRRADGTYVPVGPNSEGPFYRETFIWRGEEFPLREAPEILKPGQTLRHGDSVIEGGQIWTVLSHVELPMGHELSDGRYAYVLNRDTGIVYEIDRLGGKVTSKEQEELDRAIGRTLFVAGLLGFSGRAHQVAVFARAGPAGALAVRVVGAAETAALKPGQFLDKAGRLRNADGTFAPMGGPKSPSFDTAKARKAWEEANGRSWPTDPRTGRPFDAHHIERRVDGGALYDTENILPVHPEMHRRIHVPGSGMYPPNGGG